jgi:hypothetical protein
MVDKPTSDVGVEETWVNVTEAAELMGYHRFTAQKLARDNWNLPEDERRIRVRRLSNGYLLWLPDLIDYISTKHRGPNSKYKHPNT